ncbi:MAG: excisionase family DNA-binding protein [Thermomicrobiales bacterium]|nr:excisionase family DNA-binding protein [Thermomicrobiales bacterium]
MADFQAGESENVRSRVVPFPGEAASALLTAREAAASVGVAERTVRRAIARGELPAVKLRGAFRIRPTDLATYAETVLRARVRFTRDQALPAWIAWQPLPEPSTPLVGRMAELRAIEAALANPAVRLLTLTGPGGIGKTRLAIAAAQTAEASVAFVNLAPLTRDDQVLPAIAQALGLDDGDATPLRRLCEALQEIRALLLLDNVEHVLGAAPLLARLLEDAPGLTILATSRAALHLRGEHVLPVPPLSLPAGAGDLLTLPEIARADAVALFVARAQAGDPAFQLGAGHASTVAAICQRLEGIPLALELAASWIRVLSPEALLARLAMRLPLLVDGPRDAPERQQTMRRAIAWSFDLLTEAEQALFCRLAVFAGGFTVEAVEAVAADLVDPGATLALFSSLLDKSMVLRDTAADPPRFLMLETIREFGLEQALAAGEADDAHRLHAGYMARLVMDAEGRVPRPDRWWCAFDRERENLRAALDWCVVTGERETGLRLAVEVFGYWMLRGMIAEGIGWLEQLRSAPGALPPDLQARAALGLGYLQWFAGNARQAELQASEAREIGEATGNLMTQAVAMFLLGFVGEARGDLAAAALAYQAAHDFYQAVGLPEGQASVNAHLGRVVARTGDPARGRALLRDALGTLEGASGAWGSATAHADLGLLALGAGDRAQAVSLLLQSLRRHVALDDRLVVLPSLTAAARVLAEVDASPAVARLLGAAQTLGERAGSCLRAISQTVYAEAEAITMAALGAELFTVELAAGRTLSLEAALDLAGASLSGAERAPEVRAFLQPELPLRPHLSRRALDVLRLVAERYTDREIAEKLFISRRTVEWYVSEILSRLQVSTRHQAVASARALGLI